jgi:hypothetical protein
VGRDAADAARDPVLSRYAIDRALSRLADPAAKALVALSGAGIGAEEWMALVRVAIRASAPTADPNDDAWLMILSRALVATAIDELASRAVKSLPGAASAGIEGELSALASALH